MRRANAKTTLTDPPVPSTVRCGSGRALERSGVTTGPAGITVDHGLRTSNRRVYAIGDVTGLSPFTHTAGYHAALVLKNALFRLPAKADHDLMPRVTYSDPELAAVGLDEAAAREIGRAHV